MGLRFRVNSHLKENPKTNNHVPFLSGRPFYSELIPNPLPLTSEQKLAIFSLDKIHSDEITQPNYLLDQSFLLSRAQLTLSLLLKPENATALQKALSEN